jgi:hypothetical protein
MKRLTKIGSRVLGSCLIACGVLACSGADISSQPVATHEGAGSVRLALQPVSGITLNTVHYVVTKAGLAGPVVEGDLPTPGNQKVLTMGLSVPVGTGYVLSFSSIAAEAVSTFCSGAVGPFDVRPNQDTSLSMQLSCIDVANGGLKNEVAQTVDGCPRLLFDFALATPNSAKINETIRLASNARDLDDKAVSYAWWVADAGVGVFATGNAANATFTCQALAANLDITLTVSNGECSKSIVTNVSCVDSI